MAPAVAGKAPIATADYTILSLRIPQTFSYPKSSTHYLYIRPHDPKLPDPRSPRSLFIVNIPVDATEDHFRTLFAQELGGVRVEQVEFETTKPTKSANAIVQGSRKRKRNNDEDEITMSLPPTWDREVQRSGSAAIVVFVDKPSMESAMKHVKKAAKARNALEWDTGLGERLPALGSQSTCSGKLSPRRH